MLSHILTRLFVHTILSLSLAAITGTVLGLFVGFIRQRIQDTLYVSIAGALLGCLFVCSVPPVSIPGSLETWGAAGGLGSLQVVICLILIILGGAMSSLLTSTFGFKLAQKLGLKWLLWISMGIYTLMAISLRQGYLQYCSPDISYC